MSIRRASRSSARCEMVTTLADLPALPAIVSGRVYHLRTSPLRHRISHSSYQWLVDLDDLPRPAPLLRTVSRFVAHDHLGGKLGSPETPSTIKTNVQRFLAANKFDDADGRIVMLANPRIFGHAFNPITIFWCFASAGNLACVIAEVHNTYSEMHAYLLHPNDAGQATTDKAFYVSPFNDTSGHYEFTLTLTRAAVSVEVALVRTGHDVFTARFFGTPRLATNRAIAATALRMPAMTHKVTALIRLHGVVLWLKRLPIVRRERHTSQDGV